MRILASALMAGAALSLSGCAYGLYGNSGSYGGLSVGVGYGDGYSYGQSPYGYGYSPYGYDYGSYDPWYGSYGGSPYWGWYGDRYYPGTGYYVYDRYRRPYLWNDRQRTYWTRIRDRAVRERAVRDRTVRERPQFAPNWESFERNPREARRGRANEERRDRR